MGSLAPIVIFVYARPIQTEELLCSLAKCPEAKESILYIFSDAPKKESAKDSVERVRQIVNDNRWKKSFAKVVINEAQQNKGLAKSIISGVSEVINIYGRVIVVEDDNRVSSDFLDYMNRGLDFYADKKKIGEIGAYCVPITFPADYRHDVFAMGRGSSYAWASWKDRWNSIDWNVKDFNEFKKNKKRVREFKEYGEDLYYMLENQMLGKIDSWAIRSGYSKFQHGMLCIMPVKTRVENSGFDGTGVHNVAGDIRFISKIEEDNHPVVFEDVDIDPRIKKEYVQKFKIPLILKVKRIVKRIMKK